MTKEEIERIVGNQLIAEFMEYKGGLQYMYKISWNWLMPVVEKISTIQFTDDSWIGSEPYQDYAWPRTFGMRNEEGNYMVRFNANSVHTAPTLIEAVWLAVVDFIKWHTNKT
jgi:hypothetical protein